MWLRTCSSALWLCSCKVVKDSDFWVTQEQKYCAGWNCLWTHRWNKIFRKLTTLDVPLNEPDPGASSGNTWVRVDLPLSLPLCPLSLLGQPLHACLKGCRNRTLSNANANANVKMLFGSNYEFCPMGKYPSVHGPQEEEEARMPWRTSLSWNLLNSYLWCLHGQTGSKMCVQLILRTKKSIFNLRL